MTSYQFLNTDLSANGIFTLTLNRPDKLNSLNKELLGELYDAIRHAKTNESIKAILLTGAGKAFCAGANINELAELNAQTGLNFAEYGQRVFRELELIGKPSLTAVNGFAFGGGCELCMSTSMRIASTNAVFGQPEVKLGVIPGFGGTQRLARLVGKGRAIDMCITARSLKAEDALTWGLVTEVVAPENLLTRAQELLTIILQMGPLAISSVLKVIDSGYDMPLDDALHLEAIHFAMTCGTEDKREGTSAFLEKRAAAFTGK